MWVASKLRSGMMAFRKQVTICLFLGIGYRASNESAHVTSRFTLTCAFAALHIRYRPTVGSWFSRSWWIMRNRLEIMVDHDQAWRTAFGYGAESTCIEARSRVW
jgi:hypothetical protein